MRAQIINEQAREETERSPRITLNKMDAIAYGVAAKYKFDTKDLRRIDKETVAVARKLGIPKDEIEEWSASQFIYDNEKTRIIKSFLESLQESYRR